MAERRRALRIAAAAIGLGAAAAAGALWWASTEPAPGRERPPEPRVEISPRRPGPVGWTLAPGQTLAIAREEVPARGHLGVDLRLGAPEAGSEPLAGRILAFDEQRADRVRPLQAQPVGEARDRARVELPADLLLPGVYLIEIRTREQSHIPLLRYRLEIR